MWKEILVDDDINLEENANIFNDMKCPNVDYILNKEGIRQILLKKTDSHCYQYIDNQIKINTLYKYDFMVNRIAIFQFSTKVDWNIPFDINKFHGIVAEFVKIILNRHGKIVRFYKYPQSILDELTYLETKFRNSDIELRIRVFGKHGVKVIDYPKYWEFELM